MCSVGKKNPNKPLNLALHYLLTATKSFPERPPTGSPSLYNLKDTINTLVKCLKAGTKIYTHLSSGPSGVPVCFLKKPTSF